MSIYIRFRLPMVSQPVRPYCSLIKASRLLVLAGLLSARILFNAGPAHAEACENLAIKLVQPEPPNSADQIAADKKAIELGCNGYDDSVCVSAKVGSRFKRTTRGESERIHVQARNIEKNELDGWLDEVLRSPVYRRMSQYRIEARRVARMEASEICAPNLVLVSKEPIADLGFTTILAHPIVLDQREYGGLILFEEGHMGPISLFSKEALQRADYLDYTLSHEMGHALLQDLYGIEGMKTLLDGKMHSREGHFASETTDEVLAWAEGFAEGFEAHLGELFPGSIKNEGVNPAIHLAMSRLKENAGYLLNDGLRDYPDFVMNLVEIVDRSLPRMDDLFAEFLRMERQSKVRGGFYVIQGRYANLAHDYEL
ncbi:MAG: hypothetical protein AAB425_13315, partial [Bdellovibrionota bacterium]